MNADDPSIIQPFNFLSFTGISAVLPIFYLLVFSLAFVFSVQKHHLQAGDLLRKTSQFPACLHTKFVRVICKGEP